MMRPFTVRSLLLITAVALSTTAASCTDDEKPVTLSTQGKAGLTVVENNSGAVCHSTNGDQLAGPTWKGSYGSEITLKGGKKITVDAEYIKRSIREPNAQRREDAGSQMPTFDETRITDAELDDIVAYLKDLGQ